VWHIAQQLRERMEEWRGYAEQHGAVLRPVARKAREKISKALCRNMRHQAQRVGLRINAEKWCDFYLICHAINDQLRFDWTITPEHVLWVVENCPKGRFELCYDIGALDMQAVLIRPCLDYVNPRAATSRRPAVLPPFDFPEGKWPFYIRCVQGHSDGVMAGGAPVHESPASVFRIVNAMCPDVMYHCTFRNVVLPIVRDGLQRGHGVRGARALHYMILHPGHPDSGYKGREGAPVVLKLDGIAVEKMMRVHGHAYYVTSEHCVLSDEGLPPCAIVTAEDRQSGRTLYRRDRQLAREVAECDDPLDVPPPLLSIECPACHTLNPQGAGCCLRATCVAVLSNIGYRDLVSSFSVEERVRRAETLQRAGIVGLQFWADPHQGPVEESSDAVRCEPGQHTLLTQPAETVAARVDRADSAIMQGAKRKRHGENARAFGTSQYWKHKYNGAVKNGYQSHAQRYDTSAEYRQQMRSRKPTPVPRVAWHEGHHPHTSGSSVAGQLTGELVIYPEEIPYLEEAGYGSDGPDDDAFWVASSAASASGYHPSSASGVT